MPAYPSPFHLEHLEGLEAHPDHPGARGDTEGRIRVKALSGIARFDLVFEEKPAAVVIRVDGWTDALEGLDMSRAGGEHRSLIETGDAEIGLTGETLTVTLRAAALDWIRSPTRFQLIDRYR